MRSKAASQLVKLDILINRRRVDVAMCLRVGPRARAELGEEIPRQLFEIRSGSRGQQDHAVKQYHAQDVLAKCYGSDINGSEKQKEGKKRMRQVGI